jgi:hypothetical protein
LLDLLDWCFLCKWFVIRHGLGFYAVVRELGMMAIQTGANLMPLLDLLDGASDAMV